MAYQSEAQLEKNLHSQLVNLGYTAMKVPDFDALLANFRKQLN